MRIEEKSKKKKKKKDYKLLKILLLIGLVIAVCILIYPTFMDSVNDITQCMTISGYQQDTLNLSDAQINQIKEQAIKYNARLYSDQLITPFVYMGTDDNDEEYRSILRASELNDIMGYVEIPIIDVYLPITHGTNAEDLTYRVGHMYGTSVPIGGDNTHSVITAHTGLETADLFTNIEKLVKNDKVFIHVLNEIHVYNVDEIDVVEPDKFSDYLQIEEGRDILTLFTCTPYGINSHRLLVKCERTGDLPYGSTEGGMRSISSQNLKAIITTILWCLIPLLFLIIGLILIFKKKKKKDKKKSDPKQISQENEQAKDLITGSEIDKPEQNASEDPSGS